MIRHLPQRLLNNAHGPVVNAVLVAFSFDLRRNGISSNMVLVIEKYSLRF
jgi:hypothetical protein